jgi:PAS domain S-box-containing protein
MLNVESTHEVSLTDADLALMVALSKNIEVAIGRARLYENIQQELAERKRAEEALQEARSFLQQVVDMSPGMIFVVDGESRIIFANQFMAEYYGSTPEELISKTAQMIHPTATEVLTFVSDDQLVSRTRTKIVKDEKNTAPNGEQHWFHTIKVPLLRPNGTVHVLGIATDITELKRAEEELEQHRAHLEELVEKRTAELQAANEHLAAASRVKDEFVSNVSHELRTPLTSIKLYIELMLRKPEKRGDYLLTLVRETDRLQNLIEGLLSLSRMDSGREQLDLQPLSLNGLVKEIATDRMALAESKHLTLNVELEAELPMVSADQFQLGQVFSIVLTNALNYSPPGGAIRISTQTCQNDGRLWVGFGVSDVGPGIDPGEIDKLFTRFFRGKAGLASGLGGTGLGLAIAREIVEKHEGRVEALNNPPPVTGATFRVWLPA